MPKILPWLLLSALACARTHAQTPPATEQNDTCADVCPTFECAQSRIQARVEYLLTQVPKRDPSKAIMLPNEYKGLAELSTMDATPNLIVALATVIATRAKEEARLWLIDQLVDEVCGDVRTEPYFKNTCTLVKVSGQYPGPSIGRLKRELQRDLYALPACHVYQERRLPAQPRIPALDSSIDPYIIEAVLVALYESSEKKEIEADNAPSLLDPPGDKELAALLVMTLTGDSVPFAGWTGFRREAFFEIQNALADQLKNKSATLSQRILRVLDQMRVKKLPGSGAENVWMALDPSGKALQLVESILQLEDLYRSAAQGDYLEVTLGAASDFMCNQSGFADSEFCARLPLIGEVAEADKQEEMEAALDRAISPIGSWRRKQSEALWSLNAMAGFAVGSERLKLNGESTEHTTTALYMPIAIEYSWPVTWGRWLRGAAVGVTALDLGGIVSYSEKSELQGGETSSAANSDLSSVTAPGFYVAVAFKDSPFRAGISASRTPELRSVKFDDATETDVDSARIMFFVTVDVTLIGL